MTVCVRTEQMLVGGSDVDVGCRAHAWAKSGCERVVMLLNDD
jgi:hypothetical protein